MSKKTFIQEIADWMQLLEAKLYDHQKVQQTLHDITQCPEDILLTKKERKVLQSFLHLLLSISFVAMEHPEDWQRFVEFHREEPPTTRLFRRVFYT